MFPGGGDGRKGRLKAEKKERWKLDANESLVLTDDSSRIDLALTGVRSTYCHYPGVILTIH